MYDLNVPWPAVGYAEPPSPAERKNFHNTVAMLYSFGYRNIVVNFTVPESVKLPVGSPEKLNPMPMGELRKDFAEFPALRLFSRVTLVINDPAKTQNVSKINNTAAFDIVAVQPTTEKALQLAATNLDIDVICMPMGNRWPFFLKHKTVGSALAKGIKFEICYSGLVAGPAGYASSTSLGASGSVSRKCFLSNCLQLLRAARCRGLVFSSGATEPLHVRNYADVLAMMGPLGLKASNAKDGFTAHPESVLVKGRLRFKSHKQTVMVGMATGPDSRAAALTANEAAKRGTLADYKRPREPEDDARKRTKV